MIDHKQKILPMMLREGMIQYFGKRGISLLGAMLVRKVVRDGNAGFEYVFYDTLVKHYNTQDTTQVSDAFDILVERIKADFPELTDIIVQSENASCLASHNKIPYVHFANKSTGKYGINGVLVKIWLHTEAQTGRGRLDTHLSYVNIIFSAKKCGK